MMLSMPNTLVLHSTTYGTKSQQMVMVSLTDHSYLVIHMHILLVVITKDYKDMYISSRIYIHTQPFQETFQEKKMWDDKKGSHDP